MAVERLVIVIKCLKIVVDFQTITPEQCLTFLKSNLSLISYRSISCDVTRHSGRHICAPQIRGQIHTKTVITVILLAIIMDSGENRADKSIFTNQHHSTPFSGYAKNLDGAVKQRYLEKIECIGIDPILLEGKKFDPDCLPPVESADILTYLVLETSYYTKDQFKNFRSLEALTC